MPKTIRELAEKFGISKQAVNKRLTPDFRRQHVTTKTINGVATLLVDKSGEMLLKRHLNTDNADNKIGTNDRQLVVDVLYKQIEIQQKELAAKNEQLAAKDDQLKAMQNLMDQQQRLALQDKKILEEYNSEIKSLKTLTTQSQPVAKENMNNQNNLGNIVNQVNNKPKKWWPFSKRG